MLSNAIRRFCDKGDLLTQPIELDRANSNCENIVGLDNLLENSQLVILNAVLEHEHHVVQTS